MKKILSLLSLICLFSIPTSAQKVPTGIPFQGIAKDHHGAPVNERKIFIQTNLIAGSINGNPIYTEEYETTTDPLGIFSIMIGQGIKKAGTIQSLADLKWEEGPYYLNIQLAISPNAPVQNWVYQANWVDMGTTALGIVPYAFYAVQTGGLQNKLSTTDTANMLRNYVSKQIVQLLDSVIATKLSAKDTVNMLAPYVKASATQNTTTSNTSTPSNTFSGAYSDLTGKPVLFDGDYNTLTNKPILFDGDYNTLINRPSLFNGDYNTLTNKPVFTLNGDITNIGNITTLANSGVASGTYGSALAIPTITVDAKGRITAASSTSITPNHFPNKTNAEKNAMPLSTATGSVIWCSDCGTKGQLQVYNGIEWTDLTGAPALTNDISFGSISTSNISSSSASITTSINTDGGNTITARGIVWNTSIHPTIALSTKTSAGTGTGTFSASLSGLSASTVYYVRTYATNGNGTVYGNEISFSTTGIIPSLTTTAASSININGFTTGGNISSDGGNLVTYRGICWSTSVNPTINDNRILSGTGTGTFTITLSNLNVATAYYVRAFATNSAGTAYGNQQTINTSSLVAGTSYKGGKIAYIFQSGDAGYVAGETHGFIIMNHAMGMQAAYGGYNASTGYFTSPGTSMNFGTGRNNTLLLYNLTGNHAAKYIYNVNYDGYNDWYLPSAAEWTKIATNWTSLGVPYGSYQSSSEVSQQNSAFFDVYNSYGWISASISNSSKTSLYNVIGIRNF